MPTLICGSVAYDTIMVFPDRFKHHILPDKVHMLSVSFLVPEMRREFGGCAGNIAYNLHLLGGEPVIMATVGQDFGPYAERLDALGIRHDCTRVLPTHFTPQCFITNDLDDNQITAFHPGAMSESHDNRFDHVEGLTLALIGPDGREGMLARTRELKAAGIPFVFDPGQGMPLFSGEELLGCVAAADYLAMNDYEAALMTDKTGKTLAELAAMVRALIVTRGADGSTIYVDGREIAIPAARAEAVLDPTGCGDAYRAGLLFGIERGWDWETTGRLASLLGALKIAQRGGQNHRFDRASLAVAYREAFGCELPAW
ncbi:carbohydrate kinase family protein [Chitinimonas koreensis]|uniref:carbohydrate kinase family protein n=1 Tax=Chitinimonas koreensis TaxID=356302 RepID=UPI0005523A29|nr:carbohydrate kinase family protein [Chitinimonas koreensis]QNM97053.1 carbohydrate kinase family protein [Chitinimonas koreensis]